VVQRPPAWDIPARRSNRTPSVAPLFAAGYGHTCALVRASFRPACRVGRTGCRGRDRVLAQLLNDFGRVESAESRWITVM
jgi:hypothetical protein